MIKPMAYRNLAHLIYENEGFPPKGTANEEVPSLFHFQADALAMIKTKEFQACTVWHSKLLEDNAD